MDKQNTHYFQLLFTKDKKVQKDITIVIQEELKKTGFISMMKDFNLFNHQKVLEEMHMYSFMKELNETNKN